MFKILTLLAFQRLLQYANKFSLLTYRNHLPVPFGPGTVRAFHRGEAPVTIAPQGSLASRFLQLHYALC